MRILWLKTELLHPLDKGGRIRTYQMLKALKRRHHITYLALDDGCAASDAEASAREYCHHLERIPFRTTRKDSWRLYVDLFRNLFSRLPYAVAKYRSGDMESRVRRRVGEGGHDLVVCDFLFPSRNVPRDLDCPTVLFQHNVEAEIWRRHVSVAGSWVTRLYMGEQWRRMRAIEGSESRRFEHVVAVSRADAETMREAYSLDSVSWVPTGVDVDFFRPKRPYPVGGRKLVFTGAMDWLPNEDAIEYFGAEILPRIRARVPDAELVLVGRNPTARVTRLAERTPGMTMVGGVPDVRPYMEQASVFVVPIRVGGGTRLKVFEAMAMERPVVSTSVGVEGLPVQHGEHVSICDDPDGFARAVVDLLEDPEKAAALGLRGASHVREEFGWAGVAEQFARICEGVVSDWSRRGRPKEGM